MSTRSMKLNMNYQSMWSLLDDVETTELEQEFNRLSKIYKETKKEQDSVDNKLSTILSKKRVLRQILDSRKYTATVNNLVVSSSHVKLLKNMQFVNFSDGGDYVFMGVDGKRPFGNSYIYRDVAEILGWKLPNDDLSDNQFKKAEQLLYELPIALNKILEKIDLEKK